MGWQHNKNFFPDYAPFRIIDIMNFVKNDPFKVTNNVRTRIQHRTKNLCCHDKTPCFRLKIEGSNLRQTNFLFYLYLAITSKQTDIAKSSSEIAEFLIRKSFYRRCVNNFRHVLIRIITLSFRDIE